MSKPLTKEFDLSRLISSSIFGEIISLAAILICGPPKIETKNCNDCRLQFGGFSILNKTFEFAKSGYFESLKSAKRLKMGT